MCNGLLRLTRGSFQKAYVGYLLLAALLTNFISSPMVVYAIVSPLMAARVTRWARALQVYVPPDDRVRLLLWYSASPHRNSRCRQYTGFLETYGFTGMTFEPIYFFMGAWPVLLIVVAWSAILGPKFAPAEPVIPIATKAQGGAQARSSCLLLPTRWVFFCSLQRLSC